MDDCERVAGLMGARRSTDPAPIPLDKKGLEAAFVAFGFVGNDKETQTVLLKLMRAVEAYLQSTQKNV